MMIWRNLDPKLLGELLVATAEAFAVKRKASLDPRPPRAPFRLAPTVAAPPPRPARRARP